MLTIGEFSRICFVSKKTLRYYDEIGLLRPEHIAENGYRYYTVSQLRTMLLISRLKTYRLSLPEIAGVLASPNEELLEEKLLEKHRKMTADVQNTHSILRQMEQDIEKLKRRIDIMKQDIIVKTVELAPLKLYGLRKKIDLQHCDEFIGEFYKDVEEKQLHQVGPLMMFYCDAQDFGDVEVAMPVAEDVAGMREQPGGLHCFATIVGPYKNESFTSTYAGLVEWIEENGYHISGAPFDKYVRGGDGVSPQEYVTEVYFPIAK